MVQMVKAGLQICRRGKLSYVGRLRLMHEKVEIHSDDGDLVVLTVEAFRRELVDGDIQILVPNGHGELKPVSQGWREDEGDVARRERNKRVQILNYVNDACKHGALLKDTLPQLAGFCSEQRLGAAPSERTLRNWRVLARGHESMLSPAWNQCGNRYQGPDEILLGVIQEVFDVAIAGNDLFSMSRAWHLVEARFDQEWKTQRGDSPQPRHSIKKLKNFMRAMPWDNLLKIRMDGRTVRAMTRTAVHSHSVGIFWECVEMDATVLDILVCDDDGNEIGRPILYVAIDVATGYVVGLHLTIQKPSTLPFVECLRYMYFPKPDGFDAKYGIENRLEVFGKPVVLRVDNGSEFIGKAATELVRQLYGDTARCQPYKPEEKPHVERFNGTLKAYVLTLSGATISSVTGKQRPRKSGEKLFTIDELRGKIYRFIYDSYSLRVNELRSIKAGKAMAPLDIWRQMSETFTQPVPVGRDEFERSLCFTRQTRALGHDGISFDGWTYHSDELARMYMQLGPGKYEFLSSELDAVTIQVRTPNSDVLIAAYEKSLDGSIDRVTAREVRKNLLADAKQLNRRTFGHALVEFQALKKQVNSSRGRAKQARVNDIIHTASEHTKRTMRPEKPVSTQTTLMSVGDSAVSLTNSIPRGRKMGERR